MPKPSVSIVMPVFQGSEHLRRSIPTCLREFGSGLAGEIVAVDDASQDDSLAVLRSYGPSVVAVSFESHRGRNPARNEGLARANGTYVKFLDQDDELEPGSLAEEIALGTSSGADIVVSGYRIAALGDPIGEVRWATPLARGIDSLLAGEGVTTGAVLYRRDHLAGIQWEERAGKVDDWRFLLAACLKGGKVACRRSIAYTWRQHAGQHSRRTDLASGANDFYDTLDWLQVELERRSSFSGERRLRLAQYRYKQLGILARFDRVRFERELSKILELDPGFVPIDEESRWWMRLACRVLGLRRAVLTASRIRRSIRPRERGEREARVGSSARS